jgi:archaeosortase A (PGF-CTERM-specific)
VFARYGSSLTRPIAAVTWGVMGLFWLAMAPHFLFAKHSVIEGALAVVALPACLYVGLLLYRGRDSLLLFSKAVGVMGLLYLPFLSIVPLERTLIQTVTGQVEVLMATLGYTPEVVVGEQGYRSTFRFVSGGHAYEMRVLLACTGIGTISIFGGLIAALDAPPRRKLAALAIVVPVVWVLNLIRVAFISIAHGEQWFAGILEGPVMALFATTDPNKVSFIIADKILSQSLSIVALVVITLLLVRVIPELIVVIEELLAILLGEDAEDLDLDRTLGV